MIEFLCILAFVLFPLFLLFLIGTPRRPWRQFDGRSGPLSNHITIGESPFRQRDDGTWYDPKTGQDLEVLTWSEFLEKYKDKK